jgi:hypothetical protein
MNKIVGFTISKQEKNHNDINPFNRNINLVSFQSSGFYIYLWGIGDLEKCIIDGAYSLSFPLSKNLLNRNVLIRIKDHSIEIENDWLGSIPIFYNSNDFVISTLSLKTLGNKNINEEGLTNYLRYGYSVFRQTAFKDVSFLRHFSKIIIQGGQFFIEHKEDPACQPGIFDSESDEKETLSAIREYIHNVEEKIEGDIILPTSGGFDSRLLNAFVKNKSRIKSFTYGISSNPDRSREVVYASKLSELLNTEWEQIKITTFYKYIPEWFSLYGFSTHFHGMYHIQFYDKIIKKSHLSNYSLLSGIIGDVWSGNVTFPAIDKPTKIKHLAYSHGIALNKTKIKKVYSEAENNLFQEYKSLINNHKFALITSMRMKIMLLSYILQIPEYFGIPSWSPFLDFSIVTQILNIPENRKKHRRWQTDFFKRENLWLEGMNLAWTKSNRLNFIAAGNYDFQPIDPNFIKDLISPFTINQINSILRKQTTKDRFINTLLTTDLIKGVLSIMGLKDRYLQTINEYCVIKPLELSRIMH